MTAGITWPGLCGWELHLPQSSIGALTCTHGVPASLPAAEDEAEEAEEAAAAEGEKKEEGEEKEVKVGLTY